MRYREKIDPHNGLLNVRSATPLPGYWRYLPSPALAPFVEHFWTVEWDLAEPVLRETLPYPNAHIILEPGICALGGVSTKKFSRVLAGKSRVLGTKFQPGGLRPFIDRPVSALTDKVVALEELFGAAAADLGRRALAHTDHHAAIGVIESFLLERDPRAVDELELLRRMTARIAGDREMRTVEALGREFGLGVRSLQRLFREFVGVSPKWMIRRFRMQEAAETLAAAARVDWAELALGLGYTDQAHFNRDFKRLIGTTPGAYFKALADKADG
ncbi:helix-turn-helix domain-containing protein [Dokdonella immobilis]|uniref:AraC-type DNA-binding protein n=1 Tax=Dokdonella immobilis TaxID=578942 RepID=A0A1I5AMA7_9GAMM|nr:helix-turn-helix domain-containing protein [Dokdonella immobilis]SFN63558.1 AraC-type DNA-binding protein [Dokdonella immobilis]